MVEVWQNPIILEHIFLQALVNVAYNMDVNLAVNMVDIEECAIDVGQYISDGDHWPHPILPGSTDCPAMELIPPRFDVIASRWICPQAADDDESECDAIDLKCFM